MERLAIEKAKVVARQFRKHDALIIGSDTIVHVDGEIVGKPRDKKDAVRILKKLSGKTHKVYTGVSVINARTGKIVSGVDRTSVTFRKLTRKQIREYVATGEPLDKGGAYAIQMGAADFVEKVDGSYTNVVGLPLLVLQRLLEQQGFIIRDDVSRIIFSHTDYYS